MEQVGNISSMTSEAKRLCGSEARHGKRFCESDARPSKRLHATKDEYGDYDVYISHRGPDTKMGFVGYLYEALKRAGLHPFLDCKSIGKGQDAWNCIHHAIQTTPLAVVIFSRGFAESEWCLKELHALLHSPSMKVLPIFYNIQPWEVRFPEKGQLATGFTKMIERHDKTLIEEWRADLKRASETNGWEHNVGDTRMDADLVQEVVGKIFELANIPFPLDVGDHIVGVKQVANYDVYISHGSRDTKMGFVGYLYEALKRAGLHPFLDCKSIGKGQDAWNCIHHAIQTTPLVVVIFSTGFAESQWCLKELHVLLHSPSMKVLPIFYNIQPWEVRFPERGQLVAGFTKMIERHDKTLIEEWRADLKRASMINGWEHNVGDKRMDADLVQEVVGKISELANNPFPLDVGDHIVGMKQVANYDVYISHRGPDTKMGFVGYLYEALKRAGLHPFLDCKSIGKGQDAWNCIHHAIQTTPLAVVIFSRGFAESEWCLKELHALLHSPSMKVLPIFYNIQPWEVRFPEKGQLAAGFTKMIERHDKTLIEEWRVDLKRASETNGWEHNVGDKRMDADLVQEVVGKIFELANIPFPLDVGDHIVGVKQVAENLIQTLVEKKVLMLGLWGMGGIGKSTLARELYNQLGQRFDARCYVEDVAKKVNEGGVTSVQNHIMKALCGNDSMQNIVDKLRGKVILENRLFKKTILLVLDDVHDDDEMDYLMSHKMLKEGSMCIVTSRNRRVLEKSSSFHGNHEVHIHEVSLLSQQDSQSVFECHAFGGDWKVPPRFVGLVGDVSMACGGLPLVLKVCGSVLRNEEDVETWKEILEKLNCGTLMDDEKKIFECLQISYDSLQDQHQEMFLDIACGLLGASVEMAKLIWRSQGWYAALGVRSLVEKSLIRVDEFGALCMNNHLRDMGRTIVRQKRASMYKRILDSKSVALLNKNEPLPDSIQTLILPRRLGIRVNLSIFKELRILKCEDGLFSMLALPKNLLWLDYSKSDLELFGDFSQVVENSEFGRLPESFGTLNKLKVLNLCNCNKLMELPNSFQNLQNLEILNLRESGIQSLPKTFGTLRKLKVLNLCYCDKLVELPDSFGDLQNLENLNLVGSGIQSLPKSFGMLSKLKVLNLCSCDKLIELPNSFGDLQNLENLNLISSGIQSLPKSFGMLSKLKVLILYYCSQLKGLPDSFGDL